RNRAADGGGVRGARVPLRRRAAPHQQQHGRGAPGEGGGSCAAVRGDSPESLNRSRCAGRLNSLPRAADLSGVSQLVLDQGLRDTRSALVRWNGTPGPIVRAWLGWSVGVAAVLLVAVYAIAVFAPPDPMPLAVPGVTHAATLADVGYVLFRNGLVLALHALACVAGFIAGSSLPMVAATRRGISRWVHEK